MLFEPNLQLVSFVGVKTGPVMLHHFLAHYRNLGVERFLIIFHAFSDSEQTRRTKEVLETFDIVPVREVRTYSASIKKRITQAVVQEHCADSDWIIYADADELQIYPLPIGRMISHCENNGLRFARGRLIDRLADSGHLRALTKYPSVWEQFPCTANVTRIIAGAWDRKICLARASVPIADGGSHSIDYGLDPLANYELSHVVNDAYGKTIEIHHFKYDSTLMGRIQSKLALQDGDLDSVHGQDFIAEYQRLNDHLKMHGRIKLPHVQRMGTPEGVRWSTKREG